MADLQSAAAAAFARQRAAMAVEGVTSPEKGVLLVLAIMGDGEGRCHPSITQIAARASIGRRTAFEALDRLAALGFVERAPVPGKGAVYTLRIGPDWCGWRTQTTSNNQ